MNEPMTEAEAREAIDRAERMRAYSRTWMKEIRARDAEARKQLGLPPIRLGRPRQRFSVESPGGTPLGEMSLIELSAQTGIGKEYLRLHAKISRDRGEPSFVTSTKHTVTLL